MWLLLSTVVYLVGIGTALAIISHGDHRSRGAVAWVIALVGLPWIAIPMYWLSGQVRYRAYAASKTQTLQSIPEDLETLRDARQQATLNSSPSHRAGLPRVLNAFAQIGTSDTDALTLLDDTTAVYPLMIDTIAAAKHYVLLQSYLIRDDSVGSEIAQALCQAAQRKCAVYLLFDELGSQSLPDSYVQQLTHAGVSVKGFTNKRRLLPKFRANFRNHRKLLVVDGTYGLLGGLNIGDEYVDGATQFSQWRDTHMKIVGPAVLDLQLVFLSDWDFATKHQDSAITDRLRWSVPDAPNAFNARDQVSICAIGPHERIHTGDILINEVLSAATERLWIATPYFVPDDRVIASLKGAALRGVDVKVLVPRETDHAIFERVHLDVAQELSHYGIQLFHYDRGFMHQKVILIDQAVAVVGSANFDNRSLRLNFELLAVVQGQSFAADVFEMLKRDFRNAKTIDLQRIASDSWLERLFTRATRLLSPVL